jgi:arylformamidase
MRIIDLTLPVRSGAAGIPQIPLYEKFPARIAAATVVDEAQRALLAGAGVEMLEGAPAVGHMNTVINLVSHLGTHIDAPRHFYAQGVPIDEVPLDRLVARAAVVLDVSDRTDGAGITGDDLERCGVKPASGEVLVIRTGWTDRAWGRPEYWSNTMYLNPSVGEWTRQFDLAAVGMDCFPEKPFWRFTLQPNERGANHRCWLGAGIPMLQMLTNLGAVGPRFTITALPLRLAGMDGSPARVVGVVS